MRLIPMLTAILVTVALYFVVFERDALTAFARNEATAQTSEVVPEAESVETAAPRAVGVVVRRSEATAIDSAVDKITRQVRRHKEKLKDHRQRKGGPADAPEAAEDAEPTFDEAVEEMHEN